MMWIDVDDEPEQMEVDHESLSGFAHALLRLPGDGDWPFVRMYVVFFFFISEENRTKAVHEENTSHPKKVYLLCMTTTRIRRHFAC